MGAGGKGGGMTERREAGAVSRTRPPLVRTSDMRDDMRERVAAGTGGGCLGTDSEADEAVELIVGTGMGGGCLGIDSEDTELVVRECRESSGVEGMTRGGGLWVDSEEIEASDNLDRMESSGVGMIRGGGRCEWSVDCESEEGLSKEAFK